MPSRFGRLPAGPRLRPPRRGVTSRARARDPAAGAGRGGGSEGRMAAGHPLRPRRDFRHGKEASRHLAVKQSCPSHTRFRSMREDGGGVWAGQGAVTASGDLGDGDQDQRLAATVTATAAATGYHQRQRITLARSAPTGDMSGLKSRRSGVSPAPPRLLPTVLPSRWTRRVPCGQLWNVGPAQRPHRTVLDDVPTPTDLRVAGSSTKDMREMSEAPVVKSRYVCRGQA
jgi:hypothetical protein